MKFEERKVQITADDGCTDFETHVRFGSGARDISFSFKGTMGYQSGITISKKKYASFCKAHAGSNGTIIGEIATAIMKDGLCVGLL